MNEESNGSSLQLRTEGTNIASDVAALFGDDIEGLGVRAYNPDEIERNIVKQIETHITQTSTAKPIDEFFKDKKIFSKISLKGSSSTISKAELDQMIATLERENARQSRMRPRPNTPIATKFIESNMKCQLLRYIRSTLEQPEEIQPPGEQSEKAHAKSSDTKRQVKSTASGTKTNESSIQDMRKLETVSTHTTSKPTPLRKKRPLVIKSVVESKPQSKREPKEGVICPMCKARFEEHLLESHLDACDGVLVSATRSSQKSIGARVDDDFPLTPHYDDRVSDAKEKDVIFAHIWHYAKSQDYDDAEADEYATEQDVECLDDLLPTLRGAMPPEDAFRATIQDELVLNRRLYAKLFSYQREALVWFWELHKRGTGGILGDEMGLGKTVQVACFLEALKTSNMLKPSIICCPATTISQWVQELNKWAPTLRVLVLHAAGRAIGERYLGKKSLIKEILKNGDVVVTTYHGFLSAQNHILTKRNWGYVILDEGHKIRNPDAEITIAFKKMPTVHRFILSGTPIQNNLCELWSQFDFVCPGRLGTLPTFKTTFVTPINAGGYANATESQLKMSIQCAKILKSSIDPYLLRRLKSEVATALPSKTDQVLFCNLTTFQRNLYRDVLASPEVEELILNSRRGRSSAVTFKYLRALQDICNHPNIYMDKFEVDLVDEEVSPDKSISKLVLKSGKLMVLRLLLSKFKEQGHRVLVFSQGRFMLDVLEQFVNEEGYTYLRMDGTTSVNARANLIDNFNNGDTFAFLLTTKVGGLGLNLIGASRVILYDPDWNPSTDAQARERSWRIGQTKDVTVYRLITSGTIEEKMFHRQIFKHYLSNKILNDPKQRMQLKYSDMRDLFTLGDTDEQTEKRGFGRTAVPKKRKLTLQRQVSQADVDADLEAARESVDVAADNATTSLFNHGKIRNINAQSDDNRNVLQELYSGAAGMFRQAFNHDVVEQPQRDTRIQALEAARIAKSAAETLRREQEALRRDSSNVHIPTWTGEHGSAAVFGGSNSSEILSVLREASNIHSNASSSTSSSLANDDPHLRLTRELRSYLKDTHTSEEILDKFRSYSESVSPETFKSILTTLADLWDGTWHIKSEFSEVA